MKYKTILLLVLLAFVISLAVVVGQRLSAEAMAVVVGVVAGVAASIPTSLIVVWVALRSRPGSPPRADDMPAAPPEPRIVVVSPQGAGHAPAPAYTHMQPAAPHLYAPAPMGGGMAFEPALARATGRRQFTVIGGAGEEEVF